MCGENKRKTKSTDFWERAVTRCRQLQTLPSGTAVATYGNPSTTYKLCFDSTRKIASTNFWKRTVMTCRNHKHSLAHYNKNMENYLQLIKCAVKTHGKTNPLLFKRGKWQHVENHIHCLLKQQWQYMEIYRLLTNCALTSQGKLHAHIFEKEQ